MRRFARENGLSIVLFLMFFFAFIGQTLTGRIRYNDEREQRGQASVTLTRYFRSGHFVEAVFENWESEFLQMGAYVALTIFFRQKGSPDSKPLEGDLKDKEQAEKSPPPGPRPGRGLRRVWYENSLSIVLFGLFILSFLLHAAGGAREYSEEQRANGEPDVSTIQYIGTSQFWFESFQNWQSEFLSVGALVVLSIFLRQKGSPESKPVDAPNSETGE